MEPAPQQPAQPGGWEEAPGTGASSSMLGAHLWMQQGTRFAAEAAAWESYLATAQQMQSMWPPLADAGAGCSRMLPARP